MADTNNTTAYIYTDGACNGNGQKNAVGGWAFVCDRYDEAEGKRTQTTRYGGAVGITNNIMELTAVLEGLKHFFLTMDIVEDLVIFSDSKYITKCIKDKWYIKWESNGWRNSKGEDVANRELWEHILWYWRQIGVNTVNFKWVKGHNGNLFNEMADTLAVKGKEETIQKMKEKRKNEQS